MNLPPGSIPPVSVFPVPRAGRPAKRKRNWRLTIAVLVGVVAAVCASGSVVGYVLYDKATTPDRGTPTVAVFQYLAAYLDDRDDQRAAEFTCDGKPDIAEVKAARDDLISREKQYGITISVEVDGVFETSRSGKDAEVNAGIVLLAVVAGQPNRVVEHWDFQTRDTGGWRVCDGHEVT
jgi:hypothetical protein